MNKIAMAAIKKIAAELAAETVRQRVFPNWPHTQLPRAQEPRARRGQPLGIPAVDNAAKQLKLSDFIKPVQKLPQPASGLNARPMPAVNTASTTTSAQR